MLHRRKQLALKHLLPVQLMQRKHRFKLLVHKRKLHKVRNLQLLKAKQWVQLLHRHKLLVLLWMLLRHPQLVLKHLLPL